MKTFERFLEYVKIDTKADPKSGNHPSSPGQKCSGKFWRTNLKTWGLRRKWMKRAMFTPAFPQMPKTSLDRFHRPPRHFPGFQRRKR